MIRKVSSAGIGYSVVELHGVRHLLASAVPRRGDDLQRQARDVLATIEAVTHDEGALGSIVHQAVFVKDIEQIDACRQIIHDFYGDELPATSYIAQPPCGGKLLEIEAWGIGCGQDEVRIDRFSEQIVVARYNGVTWLHCANVAPEISADGVYDRTASALLRMRNGLAAAGFRFHQVVRTWLYLGDILGTDGSTPRYRELNRARGDFYANVHFAEGRTPQEIHWPVYPASTGIRAKGRDIAIGGIAMSSQRSDVTLFPLESPHQTSAFGLGVTGRPLCQNL